MNPIPLRHKRRTYAWACGRCGKVGSGSSCGLGHDPAMVAEMVKANADNSKRYASWCCLCHDCEAVELVGKTYGLCPACQVKEDARMAKISAEWAASASARGKHNAAAIAAAGGDPDAAARLLDAMGEANAYHWGSGWPVGCERDLWRIVTEGPERWGLRDSEPCVVDELRDLSDKAGGWWVWNDALDGSVFVPRAEWLARYADPSPEGGKVGA